MDPVERRRQEILHGPIVRTLMKLATPMIISNLLSTIYNLLDTFWLGGLGSSALSAPTMSWPVIALVFSFVFGMGGAAISLISQNRGAGRDEDAKKALAHIIIVVTLIGVPLAVLVYVLLGFIPRLLMLSDEFTESFMSYAPIALIGQTVMGLTMIGGMAFRVWGYPEIALYVRVPFVTLNAVLDPFLIYGWGPFPRLEVRGAAIATLIAEVLEAITLMILIFAHPMIKLKLRHFKLDISLVKKIIVVGAPLGVSRTITTSGFFVLLIVISRVGGYMIASWALVNRVMDIFTWMTYAFNMASATMIGQAIGNNDFSRAKIIARKTALIVVLLRLAGAILVAVFARPILEVFHRNPEDPLRNLVISTSVLGMWTFGLSAPFFALSIVSLAPFRASGKTQYDMLISIVRLWGLRVPLSYVLGILLGYGAIGVWIGMALSNLIAGFLAYALMEKDLWVYRVIE
ncbi:MAG: MATE family efflux transporter [Euryarchaeota archaeon]|nr:MATE family efflux transporter [Euryarchaeota archaeon]